MLGTKGPGSCAAHHHARPGCLHGRLLGFAGKLPAPAARPDISARAKLSGRKTDGRASPIKEDDRFYTEMYTSPSFSPPLQFAPAVQLQQNTGKGRSLVAMGGVVPGDLLLVSQPAGKVVCGPEGASLQPDQLIPHLSAGGALSDADKRRLSMLFDGTPDSSRRPIALKDFSSALSGSTEPQASQKQAASPKGFGAAKAKPAPPPMPVEEVSGNKLTDIVRFNCWGIEYAELGVAPLRKQQSHSYIGIWPEFALLNHSCVPNTQPVLVGDRVLVRAATNIPEGGELTISYLGLAGGYPVSERRRQLSSTYGFKCNCSRCKLESSAPSDVAEALERMWAWIVNEKVTQRAQQLLMSADTESTAQILQLQQEVEREVAALEELMEQHSLDPRVRQWLRASAYACYELLAVCRDEQQSTRWQVSSGEGEGSSQLDVPPSLPSEEQPELLLPLISVISPGSDTHLYLALEWLERAGKKYGSGHEKTKQASQACLAAHLMRYGRVPNELLTEIIKARSQLDYHLGRINLPSPSAAASSVSAGGGSS